MPILEHLAHLGDVRAWNGDIPLESLYTAGVAGDRWLRALQNEGKLYGTRCAHCEVTYVPARLYCERCMAHLGDDAWIEVGPAGVVESFTVLRVGLDDRPAAPRIIALLRLDGADTLFVHELAELGAQKPSIGLRVKAVLKPQAERTASIRDIAHFSPA